MRSRLAFFALLSVWMAIPVLAAEPERNHAKGIVLIDADCEDDDASGGTTVVIGKRVVQTQDAGAADGLCDTDTTVLKGSDITSSKTFGPFHSTPGMGLYITTDVDTITGGAEDFNTCILRDLPHEPGTKSTVCCHGVTNGSGTGEYKLFFGLLGAATATTWTPTYTGTVINCAIPETYWVQLVVGAGVTYGGSLSMVPTQ